MATVISTVFVPAIRARMERPQVHRQQLEFNGRDQVPLADPDARAVQVGTGVSVGCNAQTAVDAKHKLTVEQQVNGKVSDHGPNCPASPRGGGGRCRH